MDKVFQQDHFSHNIGVWQQVLECIRGKPHVRALELGSFEGRSAVWLLENILTHPTSRLTCADPFGDYLGITGASLYLRFLSNVAPHIDRLDVMRRRSDQAMLALEGSEFDLIYVDGDHAAPSVLTDAVMAWRLLRDGGIMIFDDFGADDDSVRRGVNAFAHCFEGQFEVLQNQWQLIIRRSPPPALPAPAAEEDVEEINPQTTTSIESIESLD